MNPEHLANEAEFLITQLRIQLGIIIIVIVINLW
jgi:hypothetical protein